MEAEEDPEEFTCPIKLDLMDDPVCIVHVNELEPRRRYERALLLAHFQAQYDKRIRVHMEQYADEAAQSGLSAVTVAESHGHLMQYTSPWTGGYLGSRRADFEIVADPGLQARIYAWRQQQLRQ